MKKIIEKSRFLRQVEKQLADIYKTTSENLPAEESKRLYLEGFMQAGVFMRVVKEEDLDILKARLKKEYLGAAPEKPSKKNEVDEMLEKGDSDYSKFDSPTFQRR